MKEKAHEQLTTFIDFKTKFYLISEWVFSEVSRPVVLINGHKSQERMKFHQIKFLIYLNLHKQHNTFMSLDLITTKINHAFIQKIQYHEAQIIRLKLQYTPLKSQKLNSKKYFSRMNDLKRDILLSTFTSTPNRVYSQ